MSLRPYPLSRFVGVLAAVAVPLLGLTLTGPAAAAPVSSAQTSSAQTSSAQTSSVRASSGSVPVSSLRTTGARVDVTVRGLHRTGQARWVDHVVDERITSTDGCLADPSRYAFRSGVYRSHVNLLCPGGTQAAKRAAAQLVADRPWYRVRVRSVPVVAFTFEADLESGRGVPFAAALRKLPRHDFTYVEGDDVWMVYVGTGVTQTQLDAARAAFAAELGIATSRVTVAPVRLG